MIESIEELYHKIDDYLMQRVLREKGKINPGTQNRHRVGHGWAQAHDLEDVCLRGFCGLRSKKYRRQCCFVFEQATSEHGRLQRGRYFPSRHDSLPC
jgi:hypothetical protein